MASIPFLPPFPPSRHARVALTGDGRGGVYISLDARLR